MSDNPMKAEKDCEMSMDPQEMLFLLGGLAIAAGVIARNKYLGLGGLAVLASAAAPDLVRYVKIMRM